MLKKILKITGITLLIAIIILASAPYLFKDKIKNHIVNAINESVNATIDIKEIDLSLFKNFPAANVTVERLSIINKDAFKGDTLFYSKEINLKMSLTELFKEASETMNLKSISLENGAINLMINKDNVENYDIALKNNEASKQTNTKPKSATPFSLNIEEYSIQNLDVTYVDQNSNTKVVLKNINHSGKGNFEKEKLDVETKTSLFASFQQGEMSYLKDIKISLTAILGIDLKAMKFEFKNNIASINQLPLEFRGSVQLIDMCQKFDLEFKTPSSSFKNFLGLFPEMYTRNLTKVKTSGNFTINGKVKGSLTETTIPQFTLKINANNGLFKYPELQESVKNITINTEIINKTGLVNDTYIDIHKLSFTIHKDVFNVKATIKNFNNLMVNAQLKGTMNLESISKAYPLKLDTPLSGILKADVRTRFDMKSIEASRYQNIKNSGSISLTNFNYSGAELAKPFLIRKTKVVFNTKEIRLSEFDSQTGGSDIKLVGNLENFYGFLFKEQVLKGNFKMESNNLLVSDFITPDAVSNTKSENKNEETTSALKIPSFLDCTITGKATHVVYDNLNLKNVSGNLSIKNEAIVLDQLKMNVFDGKIGMTGSISTKESIPTFTMGVDLDKINIPTSFQQLDLLKSIAPIANVIRGKLNSNMNLSGTLTKEMTPNLQTLSGNLSGELLETKVDEKKSKLLSAANSNFNFIDTNKLNLNNVKINLSFKNGKVAIQPFNLKYNDIKVTVGGTHGFDQNMNYNLKFDLPPKYLGSEINSLISKLNTTEKNKLQNIPVNAIVSGSFGSPKFSTDLQSATKNLTNQLIAQQKKKYVNKGINQLTNALGLSKKRKDSTKTDTKTKVTNTLKNLFGKKKNR